MRRQSPRVPSRRARDDARPQKSTPHGPRPDTRGPKGGAPDTRASGKPEVRGTGARGPGDKRSTRRPDPRDARKPDARGTHPRTLDPRDERRLEPRDARTPDARAPHARTPDARAPRTRTPSARDKRGSGPRDARKPGPHGGNARTPDARDTRRPDPRSARKPDARETAVSRSDAHVPALHSRSSTPKPAPQPPVLRGALPSPGEFAWTCRETFENDLGTELRLASADLAPRIAAESLVVTSKLPPRRGDRYDVTFARQMLPVQHVVRSTGAADLDARVTAALREVTGEAPWALHVWVRDAEDSNRLARSAEVLQRAVEMRAASVDARWADRRVASAHAAKSAGGLLAQVCLVAHDTALVGALPARDAVSLHPGGRARMRVSDRAPSRAAMKIEEAIDWLGVGPARGETCVDLGAAPGGWTYVVMERGAKVIAIDPGSMSPDLIGRKGLTHIRGSAFDYEPHEPVDWLLCDMVWRPLEVAALLARWGRRRHARLMIANIKLPMRGKVDFLARVSEILAEGGWQGVRMRQLYHDREEITLTGHTTR